MSRLNFFLFEVIFSSICSYKDVLYLNETTCLVQNKYYKVQIDNLYIYLLIFIVTYF
jgi:hypothetical protein